MGYELDVLLSDLDTVPNRWRGLAPDLIYSAYGVLYCTFEFKILKDKFMNILKRNVVKKHY
jgi:hypothetical protein